uniref:Uncharacterized protein n=1 Tax=Oryza barthii TaxID=65489 RepID=A0A0D3HWQ5_9ORYZ
MESLAHTAGHTPRRRGEVESPPAESGPPVRPFQDEATGMGPVVCLRWRLPPSWRRRRRSPEDQHFLAVAIGGGGRSLNRRREEETPPRPVVGEDAGAPAPKHCDLRRGYQAVGGKNGKFLEHNHVRRWLMKLSGSRRMSKGIDDLRSVPWRNSDKVPLETNS